MLNSVPYYKLILEQHRIGKNPITLKNVVLTNKQLIPKTEVISFLQYVIIFRNIAKNRMFHKEVIQSITNLGWEKYTFQTDNHYDYLIRVV